MTLLTLSKNMNTAKQALQTELRRLLAGYEFYPADGAYLEGETNAVEFLPEPLGNGRLGNLEVNLIPPQSYPPVEFRVTQRPAGGQTVVRNALTDSTGCGKIRFLLMDVECSVEVSPEELAGDGRGEPIPTVMNRPALGELIFPLTRFPMPPEPASYPRGGFACQITRRRLEAPGLGAASPGRISRSERVGAGSAETEATSLAADKTELSLAAAGAGGPETSAPPTPIYYNHDEVPFVGMLEREMNGTAKITVVVTAAPEGAPPEERARRAELARGLVHCQVGSEQQTAQFEEERGEWRARLRYRLPYEAALKEEPTFSFELPPAGEQ